MGKGPSWWKLYAHNGPVIESVPDEAAGAALKAAYKYFEGEEVTQGSLDPLAYTVFCVLKNGVDQALSDYQTSREYGQRGAKTRWGNRDPVGEDSPPIDPLCSPIGSNAEDRRKKIEDRKIDIESNADKPQFGQELSSAVQDWIKYKQERREGYKSQGLKALLTRIRTSAERCGEAAVAGVIRDSMASGYAGIAFERLDRLPIKKQETETPQEWSDVPIW